MNRTLMICGAFLTFLPPTTGVVMLRAAYTAYMSFLIATGILGLFDKTVRNAIRTKIDESEFGFGKAFLVVFVLFATEHYIMGGALALLNAALFAVTHLTNEKK